MFDLTKALSEYDVDVVRQCLRAAVDGKFFPDWEFETLFGVDRETVRIVSRQWPKITIPEEDFSAAVIGSLNNILGYPHGNESNWDKYISAPPGKVKEILDKLIAIGM